MLENISVYLDEGAYEPTRAFEHDAGLDIYTPCFAVIPAGGRATIDTGVHVFIPDGYVGKIESRSGLMRKDGITSEGTIDAGYTGSIGVILFNGGKENKVFEPGDKITQLVIYPCETPKVNIVKTIPVTQRGNNGFGSTGV